MRNGFHNFSGQIISEGTVKISDSGLADLKLSATSGMSGSPILVKIEDSFKCIGMFCGGPPLQGQYLLMKVLDCFNNNNYREALSLSEQLAFSNNKLFLADYRIQSLKPNFYGLMIINNDFSQETFELEYPCEYKEFVRNLAVNGKDNLLFTLLLRTRQLLKDMLLDTIYCCRERNKFYYNAGILINTEAFKIVRRAVEIFRNIEGDFDDVQGIEILIRQLIA